MLLPEWWQAIAQPLTSSGLVVLLVQGLNYPDPQFPFIYKVAVLMFTSPTYSKDSMRLCNMLSTELDTLKTVNN